MDMHCFARPAPSLPVRLRKGRTPAQAFRTGALEIVLAGYVACHGCSTSGVERYLSTVDRTIDDHRGTMLEEHEQDELTILTIENNERSKIISNAQHVWKQIYGSLRMRVKPRRDTGSKKAPR